MAEQILSFSDLRAYQEALELQQIVFHASKAWPSEEKFALVSQIRRSSRSIGANISEAWAKRRYPPHFVSKLTDADGELQETLHWLTAAFLCEYVTAKQRPEWETRISLIGGKLGRMIQKPESFLPRK